MSCTGHHGCGKLYWNEHANDNGCRTANTYNHYYTVFRSPSEHTIDEVAVSACNIHTYILTHLRFRTAGPISDGDASAPLQWWEGALTAIQDKT